MEVTFKTQKLRRCYENMGEASQRWGGPVARKYINRVDNLHAASNFQMLYQIRALRLHPLKGSKKGDFSINLTNRWRMIIRKGISEEHIIIVEVSNHYGD